MKIHSLKAQFNRKAMRVSIAVLVPAGVLALIFHETIGEWTIWLVDNDGESNSAVVQNIVLTIVAVVALLLGWRRLKVADQQSNTARLSLLNERFQQGVAMLTGSQLRERLRGISILEQLAKESVESHHVPVLEQFCISIHNPPEQKDEDIESADNKQSGDEGSRILVPALSPDVQAIICALENRSNEGRAVEKEQNFILDFSGCKLPHVKFINGDWSSIRLEAADLRNALIEYCDMTGAFLPSACIAGAEITESNLSEIILFRGNLGKAKLRVVDLPNANLEYCNMHGTLFYRVDLTGAIFRNADCTGAEFIDVDFLDADLTGTDFSGAKFINVKNLTKRQMAQTVGTPDILPDLPD